VVARLISDEVVVPVIRTVLDWYGAHGEGHGRTRVGDILKMPGALKSLLDALEPVVGPSLARDALPPEPVVIHRYPSDEPSWLRRIASSQRHGEQRSIIHRTIDVTGLACPLPFAKNKLVLDGMDAGQKLEILVDGSEVGTLSKSIKEEGHRILGSDAFDDGRFRLVVERGAL
jgi:TusA-related sulfurtransferase